jgi:Putative Flp pilus-assembly TadE/G-like
MNRLRSERGQAAVLTVLLLVGLLGSLSLVLDVGSWFRAQRSTQSAADAAALAGAQALPGSTGTSSALAAEYLAENDGGAGEFTWSSKNVPNDTISVTVKRQAPGMFAKLFGIDSVEVSAKASARAGGLQAAKWVAPITVNIKHPELNCGTSGGKPVPCFGKQTQIDLEHLHKPGSGNAAGAFALINLDRDITGNAGASTLGRWITSGFDEYMELGGYTSVPSAMFNDSHVKGAMAARMKDDPVLLFPIYDKITGSGANATYNVIGWVAFYVTDYQASGSTGKVSGYFEKVIWEGIQSQSGGNLNYGTTTIELTE